jgi:hypothetical protein
MKKLGEEGARPGSKRAGTLGSGARERSPFARWVVYASHAASISSRIWSTVF